MPARDRVIAAARPAGPAPEIETGARRARARVSSAANCGDFSATLSLEASSVET